ncbi:zinc finger protein 532-like [Arctopsyche grandis]|uniref:zinc finger protein 532-like n=1 Tax=Arctopsyche grandis TaxID=121162 RepID=UPI00406D9ED5
MEEMVKKLIFSKVTNTYICPPEFTTTYPCICGDRFALESSYQRHINRASVKITLFCKQCNTKLFFTNRCMMFMHLESHENKDFKYSLSDFTIEPLPIEMMKTNLATSNNLNDGTDLLKKYGILSSDDEPKEDNATIVDCSVENIDQEQISEDPIDIVTFNPSDSCQICSFRFKETTQKSVEVIRSHHYQRIDDSEVFDHTCHHCKRILPNKCSLIAHQKAHAKETPHICPECGLVFPIENMLERHMTFVCFHYSRIMYVNCVADSCTSSFREQEIQTHFKKHLKVYFTCLLCALECETSEELKSHCQSVHEERIFQSVAVYHCTVCNCKFAKENVSEHIVDHFSHATKVKYIYVCPGCKHFVMNIRQLKKHVGKCMPYKQNMQCFDFHKNALLMGKRDKATRLKYSREACLSTEQTNPSSEAVDDPNFASSPDSEMENVDVGSSVEESTIPSIEEVVVIPETTPTKPKKRLRPQTKRCTIANVVASPVSGLNSSVFNCSLCAFKTLNNVIFYRHIITHRDECTVYQCMECGLCFTYKSAFATHLEAKHSIVNAEVYIEDKKCFIKKEDRSGFGAKKRRKWRKPAAKAEIEINFQCPECPETFDNNVELDKHFRSHGMAFLMKKKR